jgi:prepilin-type N-terminal cleavage/methylation domain-containing protein
VNTTERTATRRGDAGFTLLEVMVGMTVMTTFLLMFATGITQMYRVANRASAASQAQSALSLAFLRLDKQVRYASAINTPAVSGTDYYIEFLTTNTGSPVCTQLRLQGATKILQSRNWVSTANISTATAWVPIATEVAASSTGSSAGQPFSRSAADSVYNYQRMKLDLVSSVSGLTSKETAVTFTALNTSLVTSNDLVCTAGRP